MFYEQQILLSRDSDALESISACVLVNIPRILIFKFKLRQMPIMIVMSLLSRRGVENLKIQFNCKQMPLEATSEGRCHEEIARELEFFLPENK